MARQDARRAADATLEAVTAHAGATTHGSLLDAPCARIPERLERVLRLHVEAVDIVETSVVGLRNDRERPQEVRVSLPHPIDDRIPHDTHAVRVGDQDRALQDPGVLDPGRARHLAVPVQTEPGSERRVTGITASRQDCRYTCAHRTLAYHKRPLPANDRAVADLHTRDIRDRVVRPGSARQRDAESPRVGDSLRAAKSRRAEHEQDNERAPHPL